MSVEAVAAGGAAVTAALVTGGRRGLPVHRRGARAGFSGGSVAVPTGRWWVPLVVGVGGWWSAGPVAAGVATVAVVAVRRMFASRRTARERTLARARAVEACVVLADEVRAGHDVVTALELAAEVDAALTPACSAAAVGADVPEALRGVGVTEYGFLAAAWQVSVRHGGGLADALDRVVAQARADAATARVVTSELASARSTARLLVALPLFALLIGAGSGGRPWEFLLYTTPGVVCLVVGGGLAWAGLAWIDVIAGSAS